MICKTIYLVEIIKHLSMYLYICVFNSVGMNVCMYLSSICHFSLNPEKRYEETKNGAL